MKDTKLAMDIRILSKLEGLERQLINARELHPFTDSGWASDVPVAPGVYVIWDLKSGAPIYVGETACLSQRMADFGRFRNHSARRKLAAQFKLDRSQEQALSLKIRDKHRISFVELHFGRKELEEFLTLKWSGKLLNSTTRRAHAPHRFPGVVCACPKRAFSRGAL